MAYDYSLVGPRYEELINDVFSEWFEVSGDNAEDLATVMARRKKAIRRSIKMHAIGTNTT